MSDLFKSNKFKKINVENTKMKKKAIKFKVLNQMAIIEVSDIIGGFEAKIKDGMYRTSYGIGSAIKKLYKKGIKKIIIGFGGSTVSDFGLGLAISLGVKFYDKNNNLICNKNNNFNAYSLKNIKKINLQNFFFKKKIWSVCCCQIQISNYWVVMVKLKFLQSKKEYQGKIRKF